MPMQTSRTVILRGLHAIYTAKGRLPDQTAAQKSWRYSEDLALTSGTGLRFVSDPEKGNRTRASGPIATLVRLNERSNDQDVGNPRSDLELSLGLFCVTARPGPS
jgi:hypothetical protein